MCHSYSSEMYIICVISYLYGRINNDFGVNLWSLGKEYIIMSIFQIYKIP